MIYQPRNVQPSGTSIDGAIDNVFSMEVQTNSYVSAYQLLISDFNNNDIYTGAKISLSTNLYNGDKLSIPVNADTVMLSNGENYKWRVRLYQPNADMLITYGLVQNTSTTTNIYIQSNINIRAGMYIKINEQQKVISSYDVDSGLVIVGDAFSTTPDVGTQYSIYSDFIETVPDYIVYARQTPVVSVTNIPSLLTLKYHTFQGQYTQSDNVPIVYHQFDLYTQNTDGTKSLINTSGRVYSANLSYTYDGFRTGNTYLVQMIIENDMGVIVSTDEYSFSVEYDIVEYLQQPQAFFDNKKNAVQVSWVTPVEHSASPDSSQYSILYNTPYNTVNTLYTNSGDVFWNAESGLCVLPEDFNITFQFSPDSNFYYDEDGAYQGIVDLITTTVDEASGDFKIQVDKNKLLFTQEPDINLESLFYTNTNQVFVLSASSIPQINNDYIWDDDENWNDNYTWVEGGTSLERVCNHWWKVQITKTGIKIEEIFPNT